MITARETKLLDQLLSSPLADQMRRSNSVSAEAVRRRVRREIERQQKAHEARLPILRKRAIDAVSLRDQLAKQHAAAEAQARAATDDQIQAKELYSLRRGELDRFANAGEAFLEAHGVESVADIERLLHLAPEESVS